MLKQKVVPTSLGPLTANTLTLGELRELFTLFEQKDQNQGLNMCLRFLTVIHKSLRKTHQDLTLEQLEDGLTLEDFNHLFLAVLEISGLKKSSGEAQPVAV